MSPVDLSRRESFAAIGRFFAGLVALSLFPRSAPVAVPDPITMPDPVSVTAIEPMDIIAMQNDLTGIPSVMCGPPPVNYDWKTLSQSVYVENRPIQTVGMQEMVSYKFHRATRSTITFLESDIFPDSKQRHDGKL